ncbi:uncharacterized protein LOC132286409 isoform X2 [Cornus florida]|uniref:uncharacterized protein LOC132286409 isoform X2 n=1 Tax=Cornus florida TaxID=4283 RepID=UPI00289998D5|nr:uncharacterized protein LOC132286409 isoform X2 [Cornus florida]
MGYHWICLQSILFFDSSTSTTSFRVVRIHQLEPPQRSANLKLEIFSSDTWKWTETFISTQARNFTVSHCCHPRSNAVVCNGILHWMSLYHGKIFAYDPFNNTDRYSTIEKPKDRNTKVNRRTVIYHLGKCQGHLRFIKYYPPFLSIWELKNYNGLEWSLVHKVDLKIMESDDRRMPCRIINTLSIPSLHPINGNIIYLHNDNHLVLCNISNRTLKRVCYVRYNYHCFSLFFPFVLPRWPTPVPQLQQNALRTDGRNICVKT